MTRDPRWILLAENGDCSTVGRHREPEAKDIARFEAALAERGLGGWLAVAADSFHAPTFPEIVMERALGNPTASLEEAVMILRRRIEDRTPGPESQ